MQASVDTGKVYARYTATEALYWELEYPGGSIVEPVTHDTVNDKPKGATALYLIDGAARRLLAIPLKENGHTFAPTFQRRRSGSFGQMQGGVGDLDFVILGRLREASRHGDQQRIDGLILLARGGRVIDCPPHLIDYPALSLALARYQ